MMAAHSVLLSDMISGYLRATTHRGQIRLVNYLEAAIGRRRWNVTTNHGFRIALDLRDMVQMAIMLTGTWDREVAAVLEERWTPQDVFFDIGANIGFFSLLSLQNHISHVTAFEPMPELADLIAANVRTNRFPEERLTIARVALASTSGTASYVPGPRDNSGQGRIAIGSTSGIKVPVITLDNYLAANPSRVPTIMKLDVEGLELDVLQGARSLLETRPPHTIIFEADVTQELDIKDKRLTELLRQAGYSITSVNLTPLDTKANYLAILN